MAKMLLHAPSFVSLFLFVFFLNFLQPTASQNISITGEFLFCKDQPSSDGLKQHSALIDFTTMCNAAYADEQTDSVNEKPTAVTIRFSTFFNRYQDTNAYQCFIQEVTIIRNQTFAIEWNPSWNDCMKMVKTRRCAMQGKSFNFGMRCDARFCQGHHTLKGDDVAKFISCAVHVIPMHQVLELAEKDKYRQHCSMENKSCIFAESIIAWEKSRQEHECFSSSDTKHSYMGDFIMSSGSLLVSEKHKLAFNIVHSFSLCQERFFRTDSGQLINILPASTTWNHQESIEMLEETHAARLRPSLTRASINYRDLNFKNSKYNSQKLACILYDNTVKMRAQFQSTFQMSSFRSGIGPRQFQYDGRRVSELNLSNCEIFKELTIDIDLMDKMYANNQCFKYAITNREHSPGKRLYFDATTGLLKSDSQTVPCFDNIESPSYLRHHNQTILQFSKRSRQHNMQIFDFVLTAASELLSSKQFNQQEMETVYGNRSKAKSLQQTLQPWSYTGISRRTTTSTQSMVKQILAGVYSIAKEKAPTAFWQETMDAVLIVVRPILAGVKLFIFYSMLYLSCFLIIFIVFGYCVRLVIK